MSRYEEDNSLYNDGEDKKPKLVIMLGAIILIVIILVVVISCGMQTKSSNNYLSYLKINNANITPEFNKKQTNYSVTTSEDAISISCSSESSKAKTDGCDKRLEITSNSLVHTIKVTAEDKSVRTYTLNIVKDEVIIPSVVITSDTDDNEVVSEIELSANVIPGNVNVTYQWYKDSKLIEGATENVYKATSSGNYVVEIKNDDYKDGIKSDTFTVNIKSKEEETPVKKEETNKTTTNNTTTTKKSTTNNYTLKINSISGNSSKWVKSVKLTVTATASNGLASKAYSFDGGKTYQSSNSKTFTSNQTVTIVVKDSKGKTVSKKVTISKIDNTKPIVSISASSKTTTSVMLTANVNPTSAKSGYKYQWYINDKSIAGATNKTYKATSTGVYKVKVTTGVGYSSTSKTYSFTVEQTKVTCPTLTVTTLSGKPLADKTWTNESILMMIVPSKETVSYDIYLNGINNMNSIDQNFTYFNTFQGTIKLKLNDSGKRMVKIVVRDKNGNTSSCYSKAYYLN